jgi:hypothetical protein
MTAKRRASIKRRERFQRIRRLLRNHRRDPAPFKPRRRFAGRPATDGL